MAKLRSFEIRRLVTQTIVSENFCKNKNIGILKQYFMLFLWCEIIRKIALLILCF
jgi:hypothetical protein